LNRQSWATRSTRKDLQEGSAEAARRLLDVQYDMLEKKEFPVVILISGVDGSGKGETINLLYSWMDPRHISTLAFSAPTDEESERPYMWRYWRALPPKGKVGIFAGSWYSQPITDRINGSMRRSDLDERLDEINRFEAMLVNEGALVLKFWFHLSKDGQKTRLKALEKDPRTAWRVTKESYDRLKTYNKLQEVAGHVLRVTNTAHAPWIIIEGTDDELPLADRRPHRARRDEAPAADRKGCSSVPVAPPIVHPIDKKNVLSELDLTQKLTKKSYETQLAKYQASLSELVRDPRFVGKRSLVLVFEGADAAGKGGSIRRVGAVDGCPAVPDRADCRTDRGRARPALPVALLAAPAAHRAGGDLRSLLVWPRARRAGRGFLCRSRLAARLCRDQRFRAPAGESGAIVVKFWLQISAEEQLRRFKERQDTEFKRFKITDEDWRNREKWDDYVSGRVRHGRPYLDRAGTVDVGRSQRQELRPGQGAEERERMRAPGSGTEGRNGKLYREK
jgi:polyphosphate kinase 2 (PPK2 family)